MNAQDVSQGLLSLGYVSRDGACATDLARIAARRRDNTITQSRLHGNGGWRYPLPCLGRELRRWVRLEANDGPV